MWEIQALDTDALKKTFAGRKDVVLLSIEKTVGERG